MTIPLVFGLAGQGGAIAFLISTIGVLLVALNVNQFARISASPGSLYTYITDHMHPRWGVLAGWALVIASLRRAGISVATDSAGHGVRVLSGLSRRANPPAPDAVVGSCIGGPDFSDRVQHYYLARMASRHGTTHVSRRHSRKASPGAGARDIQLRGIRKRNVARGQAQPLDRSLVPSPISAPSSASSRAFWLASRPPPACFFS
jgi:hypothetical protein